MQYCEEHLTEYRPASLDCEEIDPKEPYNTDSRYGHRHDDVNVEIEKDVLVK